MRSILPLALVFFVSGAFATEPSGSVIKTCLEGRSISKKISYRALPNKEVLSQDDYKPGYNATYYMNIGGNDIGYAEGDNNKQAIIYAGKLYPLGSATVIKSNFIRLKASQFNPYLAEWGKVRSLKNHYLCVSFSFDGLGRSGSYQKVRGGYLLDIGKKNNKLYYGIVKIRNNEADKPN